MERRKFLKVLAGSLSGVACGNAFYPRKLRAEGVTWQTALLFCWNNETVSF
jgi:hypothetical protein